MPTEGKDNQKTTKSKTKKTGISGGLIAAIIGAIVVIIAAVCIIIAVTSNGNSKADKETLSVETSDGQNIETTYQHIDDNKFFFKIPNSFTKLSSAEIAKKYTGEAPQNVWSNTPDKIDIDVAVSMTSNAIKNDQIKEYLDAMKELMGEVSEVVSSSYYTVDGHNIGQLKLVTEGEEDKIYNNMIFFSYNDKLVLMSFNCVEDKRANWEKVGDFIIDSLYFEN